SWVVGRASRASGRARPFGSSWRVWRAHLSADRLLAAFVTLFLYAQLMNAFVGIKGQIPAIQPFVWDEAFMRLDRALHFGNHPWALLQPLVGTPGRTALLDRLYYVWFPVNLIFLIASRGGPRTASGAGSSWPSSACGSSSGPSWPWASHRPGPATTGASWPAPIRSPR
ncbi:MAG: hypothetical protein ACREK7_01410, partial [Gemmatimonadota bacterium]